MPCLVFFFLLALADRSYSFTSFTSRKRRGETAALTSEPTKEKKPTNAAEMVEISGAHCLGPKKKGKKKTVLLLFFCVPFISSSFPPSFYSSLLLVPTFVSSSDRECVLTGKGKEERRMGRAVEIIRLDQATCQHESIMNRLGSARLLVDGGGLYLSLL